MSCSASRDCRKDRPCCCRVLLKGTCGPEHESGDSAERSEEERAAEHPAGVDDSCRVLCGALVVVADVGEFGIAACDDLADRWWVAGRAAFAIDVTEDVACRGQQELHCNAL